jgi:curved DNA-binding protein CbpA
METLYDLLGALPSDDAEALRTAFRRAVKGAHPDLVPGDPDAALRFREIVRASEILADREQRAAYDHLLDLARSEQEQAAQHAHAGKLHAAASSVMALAAVSAAAVGAYALFVHLSTTALPSGGPDLTRTKPQLASLANEPQPPQPAPTAAADDASTGVGPPLNITPNEAQAYWALGLDATRSGDLKGALANFDQAIELDPKFAEAYVERAMVLYRAQFDRAFADIGRAGRLTKTGPVAKKKPQAAADAAAKQARRRTVALTWQPASASLRRP